MAKIEFYIGKSEKHIAVLNDGAVPRAGEFVNIRGVTYRVELVTWAVDHADSVFDAALRANVVLARPARTETPT
jgi:hypothetical protein